MTRRGKPVQYTIRSVPADVDKVLRNRARQARKSLNQTIIEILALATVGAVPHADFKDLGGRWVEDPAFDAILAAQRMVDEEMWN